MKRLAHRLLFAFSVIALPCFATVGRACTCGKLPSPYQAYQEASAVFVGRVISSRDIPHEETVGDRNYNVYDRDFRFTVEESFKGAKAKEIDISAGRVDSTCYQGFTVGETYLVYAYPHDRRFYRSESHLGPASREPDETLFSGACTRTDDLKSARDDVYHIRALLQGRPEPRLYGSVYLMDNDPDRPDASRATYLEGIKIRAEGVKGRFEAVTDKNGLR